MTPTDQPIEVVVLSPADQTRATQHALQELGLTWEQLQEQASRKQFTSVRAHQLWIATGGVTPTRCMPTADTCPQYRRASKGSGTSTTGEPGSNP